MIQILVKEMCNTFLQVWKVWKRSAETYRDQRPPLRFSLFRTSFQSVFWSSLYFLLSYFLLSLVALSLSFQPIFTQNPISTNLKYDNFLRLKRLLLCQYYYFTRNCKILKITVQLQPHHFDFQLKTRVANYLLALVQCLTVCPRYGHSSMRTSLSSAGVSWRTLMGYPSYVRHHACALSSPSPFQYVTAKIVPAMQMAVHAIVEPCTVRRTVSSPNLFGLMGNYHFL